MLVILTFLFQLSICLSITYAQFCPKKFILGNSNNYCAVKGSINKNWKEANEECLQIGGHLPRRFQELNSVLGQYQAFSWSGAKLNGVRPHMLNNNCKTEWTECVLLSSYLNKMCKNESCSFRHPFYCILHLQNTLWNVPWCPEGWLGSESFSDKCFFLNYTDAPIDENLKQIECLKINAYVPDTSNKLIDVLILATIKEHQQKEAITKKSIQIDKLTNNQYFVCEKHKPLTEPRTAKLLLNQYQLHRVLAIQHPIFELICRGLNVRPNSQPIWYHNGDPYPEINIRESNETDYLSIAEVQLDEAKQGDYWCETWDNVNARTIISNKTTLTLPGVNNYVIVLYTQDKASLENDAKVLNSIFNNAFNKEKTSKIRFRELTVLTDNYTVVWVHSLQNDIDCVREQANFTLDKMMGTMSDLLSFDVRNANWCLEETTKDNGTEITWEQTQRNDKCFPKQLSLTTCNKIYRECVGDFRQGAYWGPIIDEFTNCLSKQSRTDKTNNSRSTLTSEIENIAERMEHIFQTENITIQILEQVIEKLDHVMNMSNDEILSAQEKTGSSNRITQMLEKLVATVPLEQGQSLSISQPNLGIETRRLSSDPDDIILGIEINSINTRILNTTIQLNNSGSDVALLLPPSLIKERKNISGSDGLRIQFIVYHNNVFFSTKNKIVNSKVVTASIVNQTVKNSKNPIEMVFKPLQVISNTSVICSYWNLELNDNNGDWSSEGCWLKSQHPDQIICECNHLSGFAIFMDLKEPDATHHPILIGITYIGCSLSIVGLSITILTFLLFGKWRKKEGNKLLCNFALALLLLLIVFLAGIERTDSPITCKAVAILLHYFILSSFCWMLVEAFQQYMLFVKVFATYIPRFLFKAMIFAWGLPLIIVIIVMGIDIHQYGRAHSCWLQMNALYYSFFLPVGIIMFINTIIFVLVIRGINRKSNLRTNQSQQHLTKKRLFASIFIFVLLGFTWLSGFLSLIEDTAIIFQYIFTICNPIQGFLIFIFIMLRDHNARDLWSSLLSTKIISKVMSPQSEDQNRKVSVDMAQNFKRRLLSNASTDSTATVQLEF